MKYLLAFLSVLVLTVGLQAQGVVRNRVGVGGQNDFYVRELYNQSWVTTTANDSVSITKGPFALFGSKYAALVDTLHQVNWCFENNTGDTIVLYITVAPCSQNGYAYNTAGAAIGPYASEPDSIVVLPARAYCGYWNFIVRTQYVKTTVKVKSQASNVAINGRWRFYFIGL